MRATAAGYGDSKLTTLHSEFGQSLSGFTIDREQKEGHLCAPQMIWSWRVSNNEWGGGRVENHQRSSINELIPRRMI